MKKTQSNSALSARQAKVVAILASPEAAELTQEQIAKRAGVSPTTLRKWQQKPEIIAAIQAKINSYAFKYLPYAWKCLTDRMSKDTQAIKLYYSLIGQYQEALQVSGPDGGPVRLSFLAKETDKDLEALVEELTEEHTETV